MKPVEIAALLKTMKARFETNMNRHSDIAWPDVQARLEANPGVLKTIHQMEATGGEPDVIGLKPETGRYVFCDCSAESPSGRRSLCYDLQALDSRKEHKPAGSVIETAAAIGMELLTEEEYRALQQLGEFDLKTSSWIKTPPDVRSLGGALFGDRRYGRVYVYHNGAQSYYASRGFRGVVRV